MLDVGDGTEPDRYIAHPVPGLADYAWYESTLGHNDNYDVYWVPQPDVALFVGTVRPNPGRNATNQAPMFMADDGQYDYITEGSALPELARMVALRHRAISLAAKHAYTAVEAVTAGTDFDMSDWVRCVTVPDTAWWDQFGPTQQPLSSTDGTLPADTLPELGLDPDLDDHINLNLPHWLGAYYAEAFTQTWHSAFTDAARRRLHIP